MEIEVQLLTSSGTSILPDDVWLLQKTQIAPNYNLVIFLSIQ